MRWFVLFKEGSGIIGFRFGRLFWYVRAEWIGGGKIRCRGVR